MDQLLYYSLSISLNSTESYGLCINLIQLLKEYSDQLNTEFTCDKNEEEKKMVKGKNFRVYFSSIMCVIDQYNMGEYNKLVKCLVEAGYSFKSLTTNIMPIVSGGSMLAVFHKKKAIEYLKSIKASEIVGYDSLKAVYTVCLDHQYM